MRFIYIVIVFICDLQMHWAFDFPLNINFSNLHIILNQVSKIKRRKEVKWWSTVTAVCVYQGLDPLETIDMSNLHQS